MTREEMKDEAARIAKEAYDKWQSLMQCDGDDLDEDGYPTELACDRIKYWHWSDIRGWFKYIEGLWHLHSFGWSEDAHAKHEWKDGETVHRYNISTAGWSGNETLISAMEENWMLWGITWVQSRRGGHYIFEIAHEYESEE